MPRATSAFEGLTPTAWAAAAFATGLIAAQTLLPSGAITCAAALGLGVAGFCLLPAVGPRRGVLLAMFCLAGVLRADLAPVDASFSSSAPVYAGEVVVAEGRAAADPRPAASGYTVLMDVAGLTSAGGPLPGAGRLLLRSRLGAAPGSGDGITATGRLRLPAETPGFDRRAHLAQEGAGLELVATQVSVRPAGSVLGDPPAAIRAGYRSAIGRVVPAPHAAVLVGVILGIRAGVPARLEQALVATGLVHLLVLSGLKVAVFARLALAALTPLLRRWATAPVLVLIVLYALAGGATAAAMRAAAMGGLVLLGAQLGRPAHVWTSLALVGAAMLAWDPRLVFDIGFQLSFLGTAAIVAWTSPIEDRLRRLPALLREPFAVTVAAQLGTLPITASGFHVLSPVAPLANALTLPLLPALVAGGLLLGPLAAFLPDIGRLAALPVDGLLVYLEQVATTLSRAPGAAFSVPDPPRWLGPAYYAAIIGGLSARRVRGRSRVLAVALAVGLPLGLAGGELLAWNQGGPVVTVLDVGDGQAVLAGGPAGWILIDGGSTPTRLSDELGRKLPPWVRRLDALVITAPGAAHVGGLVALPLHVDRVILPRAGPGGEAARGVALTLVARGSQIVRAGAGDSFAIAAMRLEVLAPEATDPTDQPGAGYLALRLTRAGGHSFCDFSDLDVDAQSAAASRLRGRCDALLLPAAGRSLPAPELLARAPGGELVLSAAAAHPARGLPPAHLRRTDQEGAIDLPL